MNLDKVKLYFISFNLYNFSGGLLSVFLNLFILATVSLAAVIYFNIFYYAGLELSYFATVYALGRFKPKDLYIIGTIIRAATIGMLVLSASMVSNVIIFGFAYGASIGTFWLGNNIITSDISKGTNRRSFVNNNNVIGNIVGFVAPALAGVMIQYSQFAGPLRFIYDFIAAIVVLLACAYVMYFSKLGNPTRPMRLGFRDSAINELGYNDFKWYNFFWNIFYLPFSIILPIYLLLLTNNYVITGLYASLLVLVSLFANYLAALKQRYWRRFMRLGIVTSMGLGLTLLVPQVINPVFSIFFFSVTFTIFSTPLNNQASSNLLEQIDRSAKDRIYFWINREYYISAGRAVTLALMAIVLYFSPNNIVYLVYIVPIATLYSLTYFNVAGRAEERKAPAPMPAVTPTVTPAEA